MDGAVRSTFGYFFPGECYHTVVEDLDFGNAQCMNLFFSRFLSLTVLAGALIVKVPQILKLVHAKSAEGLSYVSVVLELLAVTFTCTYNSAKGFPFSSWGESFFIGVQILILLYFMFLYNRQLLYLLALGPYAVMVWYLTSSYATMSVLSFLQTSVIPLLAFSRLTQIYTSFSNKSTGQLSFITSFLNFAGTASRVFTTIQETNDPIMLAMFITNFILNGTIVLQFFVYWNSAAPPKPTKKSE